MTGSQVNAYHADFIANQIQKHLDDREVLYNRLAKIRSYNSVFNCLYFALVKGGQIPSIEEIEVSKKTEIWNLAVKATEDSHPEIKTKAVKVAVSHAIYLVKLLTNEY